MEIFEEISNRVKINFKTSKGSHDFDHVLRVLNLALHIGNIEKADLDVLKFAAILHDIAREEEDLSRGKICHAEKGAEEAKKILETYGFPEDKIDKIVHCIESHRFRNSKLPESLEAKILFDADKLDSIGAVGIGRAFLFAGEIGAKLHNAKSTDISKTLPYSKEDTAYREFTVKLKFIKDKMMTNEGKRIATVRHEFMERFFERLDKEIQGVI